MTALDNLITQDLTDLFANGRIANAKMMSGSILSNGKPILLSSKGCPTHYTGQREAKTVFVNLNPGGDATINDCAFQQLKAKYNWASINDFINWYHKKSQVMFGCTGVGIFDLKTAVFLSQWPSSNITFPAGFPQKKETFCCANEAALRQKLQLELLPYCSQSFHQFQIRRINDFFPYLETVLEEIFEKPREYVIFGSGKFETLFKAYIKGANMRYNIDLKAHPKVPVYITTTLKGNCQVIYLYRGDECQKAIIAHTFPSYALPKAYNLMSIYGKLCCNEYLNSLP